MQTRYRIFSLATVLVFLFSALALNTGVSYASGFAQSQSVLPPGATVERVASGFSFIEGPAWHRDGFLLFSDTPRSQVMKWSPITGLSVYRQSVTGTNGLTFDSQNRLLVAEQDGRQLVREEPGGALVTLASTYQGKKLNSPNDVALTADGSIYFTDPPYGLGNGGTAGKELTFNGVFRLSPAGSLTLLTTEFDRPNGLAFSQDEKILYVADTSRNQVRAFDVQADGSLSNSRLFANVSNPDGLKVDMAGNVWVAALNGVVVFSPAGQQLAVIAVPEQPANVGFGGSDLKTLYITARTGLYRVPVSVAGIPHYGLRPIDPTFTPTNTPTGQLSELLSLNKPVTSSSNESASYLPALAVDGNITTRWASAFSDPQWIRVDLGSVKTINRVLLNWEAAYGKDYELQVSSDGTTWTPIKTVTGNTALSNDWAVSGSGRYIRMYGTARATQYGYSLYEFRVFGPTGPTNTPTFTATPTGTFTPSNTPTSTFTSTSTFTPTHTFTPTNTFTPTGTFTPSKTPTITLTPSATVACNNLALNKPATSSSNESVSLTPNLAVDGNPTTRWASAFSDPQWIRIDLGQPTNLCGVKLTWEAAYAKDYQVQVSNDGVSWTTLKAVTGNTTLSNYWGLSGSGRYVRIYGTARATTYGYSLYELEIYGSNGPTVTPSASPTITPTMCPMLTPGPVWVDPVTSPTSETSQVINVSASQNEIVTVQLETGLFNGAYNIALNKTQVTVPLLLDADSHLRVSIRRVSPPGSPCPYDYTVSSTVDRFGAPLTIHQGTGPTITPTFTPSPTATNTLLPASNCGVKYVVTGDWGGSFNADVTISNTGSTPINGWILGWNFSGNQTITNLWSGSYTQTGQVIRVTNAAWNGSIPAGGTVTVGFSANYSGANVAPGSFTVNGLTCSIIP